jgi:hypothetical protein
MSSHRGFDLSKHRAILPGNLSVEMNVFETFTLVLPLSPSRFVLVDQYSYLQCNVESGD